jgi:hypothetical protein
MVTQSAPAPTTDKQTAPTWRTKVEFDKLSPGCAALLYVHERARIARLIVDRDMPDWRNGVEVALRDAEQRGLTDAAKAIRAAFEATTVCPPWADDCGEHDPLGPVHSSAPRSIGLSGMPDSTRYQDSWSDPAPQHLVTNLTQDDDAPGPVVNLHRGDSDNGVRMTLEEAQELANTLLCLVATARNAEASR